MLEAKPQVWNAAKSGVTIVKNAVRTDARTGKSAATIDKSDAKIAED